MEFQNDFDLEAAAFNNLLEEALREQEAYDSGYESVEEEDDSVFEAPTLELNNELLAYVLGEGDDEVIITHQEQESIEPIEPEPIEVESIAPEHQIEQALPASNEQGVSDGDSGSDYDPIRDGEREALLRRELGQRRNFYRRARQICREAEHHEYNSLQGRINQLAMRRISSGARARYDPYADRPVRGEDRCWGCARRFYLQRLRRWFRCADCGLWLCPDCNEELDHCQNNQII